MSYLLDTNVAIHLRDDEPQVRARMDTLGDAVLLSIISQVELEGGVWRDPARSSERRARLDLMLAAIQVLPFDATAAAVYGRIVQAAGYSRRKLLDRLIATHAIANNATLVTMNPSDFKDVPNLKMLAW